MNSLTKILGEVAPALGPALAFLPLLIYMRRTQLQLARDGVSVKTAKQLLGRLECCVAKSDTRELCTTYVCFKVQKAWEQEEFRDRLELFLEKQALLDRVDWVTAKGPVKVLFWAMVVLIILAYGLGFSLTGSVLVGAILLLAVFCAWYYHSGWAEEATRWIRGLRDMVDREPVQGCD